VKFVTIFAVGFLVLDATLLAWAGVRTGRPWLLIIAAVCAAATSLPVLAWRRYRRTLAELEDDRREMKREVEELRALLQQGRSQ
jgi:hypothetical protein